MNEISLNKFIHSVEAARLYKKSNDHISLLCRRGVVNAKLIGRDWFVEKESLDTYVELQAVKAQERHRKLSEQLRSEYRSKGTVPDTHFLPTFASAEVMQEVPSVPSVAHVRFPWMHVAAGAVSLAFIFGVIPTSVLSLSSLSKMQNAAAVEAAFLQKAVISFGSDFENLLALKLGINTTAGVAFSVPPAGMPKRIAVASVPVTQQGNTRVAVSNGSTQVQIKTNPSTINNYITNQVSVAGAPGITKSYVDNQISILKNSLTSEIFKYTSTSYPSAPGIAQSTANYAAGSRIDRLINTTATNLTVQGVSGLTDADIPNDVTASLYLPLAGGTVSGTLEVTGALTVNGLTVDGSTFSTTSANYFLVQNQNAAFSTTSTNYWKSVTDLFSTTSASNFLSVNQGLAFSTTSSSYFLSVNQGNAFSTTSAIYFANASTTIPKTYTANTFTGLNTFTGNSIFTAATSSSFAVSTISSGSLLKTTTGGAIIPAIAGTDYQAAGNYATFSYLFPSNATSTLLTFSGGLTSFASSTIGAGAQATGLTIFGGATTTGNAYFAGNVGIGTTTPTKELYITTANSAGGIAIDGSVNPGLSLYATSSLKGMLGVATASGAWSNIAGIYDTILRSDGGNLILTARNATGNVVISTGATDSAKLTVTNAGNVGIGTTSTNSKLQITGGSGNLTSHLAFTNTDYVDGTAGSALYMGLGATSGSTYSWLTGYTAGRSAAGNIILNATGGNVGIGTTSPTHVLDIEGSDSTAYVASADPTTRLTLKNRDTTNNSFADFSFITNDTNGLARTGGRIASIFTSHTAGAVSSELAFINRNAGTLTEALRITSGGNVGIGTTSPLAKLSIDQSSASLSSKALTIIKNYAGGGDGIPTAEIYGYDGSGVAATGIRVGVKGTGGFNTSDAYPLQVLSNGSPTVSFQAGGNVGIGTTTPAAALHVSGTAATTIQISGGISSGYPNIYLEDTEAGGTGFRLANGKEGDGKFSIVDIGGDTSLMTITNTGNVGIGATSPSNKLHITTAATSTDGIYLNSAVWGGNIILRPNMTAGANSSIVQAGDTGLIFSSSAGIDTGGFVIAPWNSTGAGLRMTAAGSVGIGTTTPWGLLSVNANVLGAGVPQFVIGSSTKTDFIVTSAGNVGIGTTSPSQTLSIQGNQYTSGTAFFGGAITATSTLGVTGLSTLGSLTVSGNTTLANATSTNFFSTTASSTNLFAQLATLGTLAAQSLTVSGNTTHTGTLTQTGLATFTNGFLSNASSTITSGLFSMNGGASTTQITSTGSAYFATTGGNVGIGSTTPWGLLSVNANVLGAGAPQFVIGSSTKTDFIVTSSGNVGIGTTTTTQALTISGNISLNSTSTSLFSLVPYTFGIQSDEFAPASPALYILPPRISSRIIFGSAEYPAYTVDFSHTAGINGLSNIGLSTGGCYGFSDCSIAMTRPANSSELRFNANYPPNDSSSFISFYASSTERMRVSNNGNVGIGSTTPWGLLSVNANVLGAGAPQFVIGSSTKTDFIVTSSGNVGIGTTTPSALLDVNGNALFGQNISQSIASPVNVSLGGSFGNSAPGSVANLKLSLYNNGGTPSYGLGLSSALMEYQAGAAGGHEFFVNGGTAAVMINASGNVGIGTTTPQKILTVTGASQQIRITDTGTPGSNSSGYRATLYNLPTAADQRLGFLIFGSDYANTERNAASIEGVSGAAWTDAASYSSYLKFSTTPAGATSRLERMRIDSSGNVGIGTTTPGSKLSVSGGATIGTNLGGAAPTNGLLVEGNVGFGINAATLGLTGSYPATFHTATDRNLLLRGDPASFGTNQAGVILQSVIDSGASMSAMSFEATSYLFGLASGGNVGVGIDPSTTGKFVVGNNTDTTNAYFQIGKNDGGSAAGIIINDDRGFSGVNSGETLLVRTRNDGLNDTGAIANFTTTGGSASSRLWVGIAGNVGIGTSTPGSKLSIGGGGSIGLDIGSANGIFQTALITHIAGNAGSVGLGISDGGGQTGVFVNNQFNYPGATGGFNSQYVSFKTAAGGIVVTTERMRIDPFGNVGIGTSSPAAKFDVYGTGTSQPLMQVGSYTANALTFRVRNGSGLQDLFMSSGPNSFMTGTALGDTGAMFTSGKKYHVGVQGSTPNLTIDSSTGNVGIGTTSPASLLTVVGGGACFSGSGATVACGNVAGNLYYRTANTGTYDVAERYAVNDQNIAPGDVVALDPANPLYIEKAQAGMQVFGVISTDPGLLLGGADARSSATTTRPVALVGRVPVKVNLEGGDINVGDSITLSSVAGIGTKATVTTQTIGFALEPYTAAMATSSVGTIQVFIKPELTFSSGDRVSLGSLIAESATTTMSALAASSTTSGFSSTLRSAIGDMGNMVVRAFSGAISASTGIFNKIFAKQIHTDTLCISDNSGETCITKAQLDALIAGAGNSGGNGGGGTSTSTSNGSGSATSTPDTVAPTITLIGADPAEITVGTEYSDMGVTVSDNVNQNLGYTMSADGATSTPPSAFHLDTSTAGTHVILFSATDGAGNTGTATRTVIIQ